jgi:uncharacterized RDD family membrane protein YckC
MADNSNVLDCEERGSSFYNAELHTVNSYTRVLHVILDTVGYFSTFYSLIYIFQFFGISRNQIYAIIPYYLLSVLIFLVYFGFLEVVMGKTIGKMITGSQVVLKDGSAPAISNILTRTFSRLIPFEFLTYIGRSRGLHDKLSQTYVVNSDSLPETN